jgi:rhamnose transport system permease protein
MGKPENNGFSGIAKKRRHLPAEAGIAMIIVVLFVVASIIQPRFLSLNNIKSILLYLPLLITVSMGVMMVIISRNFDMSVGSIMGCSGLAVGFIIAANPGFPLIVAFVLSATIGAILGFLNGLAITHLKLHSIIVTLSTLNIYRGVTYVFSQRRMVSAWELPDALHNLTRTKLPVPGIVIIAVIIAVLTALFLKYTHIGREIFIVGSNPLAAKLRGVNVKLVIWTVFILSGMLAGFSGMIYASRFGMLNPNQTGVGFEFEVLAATIIGGISVNGGSGTVLGAVLGCVLLGVVKTALSVSGVSGTLQELSYGIIIVAALISDHINKERMKKRQIWEGSHV